MRAFEHQNGAQRQGIVWQAVAILLCFALTVLMVLNTQMSGEAMWFWYATTFRHGVKLYSELHTALQPLFVLETATWMRLFGTKIAVYEMPSLIHSFVLMIGILLILRESDWPDWQKALVLLGTFVFTVLGHSYRFDDYHVVAEAQIVYALLLLLKVGRPDAQKDPRRTLWLVGVLGLVCGLTVVTRVTDGAALIAATVICLSVMVKRRGLLVIALLLTVCALTVITVVKLTGDTLAAYLASSIFHAAGSKGGTGSIFAAPFHMIGNTVQALSGRHLLPLEMAGLLLFGIVVVRFWKQGIPYVFPLQVGLAFLMLWLLPHAKRQAIGKGLFFETVVLMVTLLMYVAAAAVLVRLVRHVLGQDSWDVRQILIVLPILEWASYSAGAAAEPLTNYYEPVALLLLLIPVLQPFRRYASWADPFLLTLLTLVVINGVVVKIRSPYSWQNYHYSAMFQNREWFHHAVYGEMYIDRDLLEFSQRVCADIGAVPGKTAPALLSLPYPYPNYFCDTPPWHNYVQTFFDTSTRDTVERMMRELATDPPPWIVYQRQINIMSGSERLYNHGRPIAQRDLDAMIMGKLKSGQWTLVDESSYSHPDYVLNAKDTDWYIIRTRP